MFLGYQKEKIVLTANTREELENAPCMTFDRIEETDAEYTFYNGEYLTAEELEQAKKQAQIEDLERQITARNIRGAILGDEYALNKVQEIEAQIAELRK